MVLGQLQWHFGSYGQQLHGLTGISGHIYILCKGRRYLQHNIMPQLHVDGERYISTSDISHGDINHNL